MNYLLTGILHAVLSLDDTYGEGTTPEESMRRAPVASEAGRQVGRQEAAKELYAATRGSNKGARSQLKALYDWIDENITEEDVLDASSKTEELP